MIAGIGTLLEHPLQFQVNPTGTLTVKKQKENQQDRMRYSRRILKVEKKRDQLRNDAILAKVEVTPGKDNIPQFPVCQERLI